MSVTASEQFPLFVLGKFGLGRIPTGAGEFSPFSPSGHGQRTSRADRARHGEHGTQHQDLSPQGLPSKGRADDEDPGQQKATHGAPPRKEPMAWEADVKALKTPVLVIAGDADVTTLEHSVALFQLLGGGGMVDMVDTGNRARHHASQYCRRRHTRPSSRRSICFMDSSSRF